MTSTQAPTSKDKLQSAFSLNEFNSKTNLTERGIASEAYNSFAARDQVNGNSTKGALAHLLKCSLGSGILAMPMAFKNAGLLFGFVGTIFAGILCTHCVYILVKTSQRVCQDAQVTSLGYSETAEKVFEYGPKQLKRWSNIAKQFCDVGLMLTHYAVPCVYTVFIAQSFHDVINYNTGLTWSIRTYIALSVIPLLFVGQIRNLKFLVPFSSLGNACIVITFAITLYYMFREPLVFSDKPLAANYKQIPIFFATVVFAMEGIGAIMPVENSMKKPQHFLGCPGVLTSAMSIVVSLYTIIGFFGYVRYGDSVQGSVTLNLPPGSIMADTAKILMALAIFFTYGLHFYVPNEILWKKISHKFAEKNHNLYQILMRGSIVLLSGCLAAAIPNLEAFISLVGAVFLSILGFFIPSLIDTLYLWPNNFGWCNWILIKNIILIILSICVLTVGTLVSTIQIIALYE